VANREKQNVVITFTNGNVVKLSHIHSLDPSIHNEADRWSGIVEEIQVGDERYKKLFRPGSGMDFHEPDLTHVQCLERGN
jgi:hypothetical protein